MNLRNNSSCIWEEVETARRENRRELVLSGSQVKSRIEKSGLDSGMFGLHQLNFLEVSRAGLKELADDSLTGLVNLTSLILNGNELATLPPSLGALEKLKVLDVSGNRLSRLPEEIGLLERLATLNASLNCLGAVPSLRGNCSLSTLDLGSNELSEFPDVCHLELKHLADVRVSNNEIASIPEGVGDLVALRTLHAANNLLETVPFRLSECSKLKEVDLKGNAIKDRRLKKMIDQCHTKSVLDYIRQNVAPEGGKKEAKKGKKASRRERATSNAEVSDLVDRIEILKLDQLAPHVKVTPSVKDVRPYIVCCILKDLDLATGDNFSRFIQLQTKLHGGICERRTAGTIATHDRGWLPTCSGLCYDAVSPEGLKIVPLGRSNAVSGDVLVRELNLEAEKQRRDKKRNNPSGVFKYLHLLKDVAHYPCVIDGAGDVISFPPITNCEKTKISPETKSIFVEVTSQKTLAICKNIMDRFVVETLKLGIGTGGGDAKSLCVEQVRILDEEDKLKVLYPSHVDLVGLTDSEKIALKWITD